MRLGLFMWVIVAGIGPTEAIEMPVIDWTLADQRDLIFETVAVDGSGNVVVGGYLNNPNEVMQYAYGQLTPAGRVEDLITSTNPYPTRLLDLAFDKHNNLLFTIQDQKPEDYEFARYNDVLLIKKDPNDREIWRLAATGEFGMAWSPCLAVDEEDHVFFGCVFDEETRFAGIPFTNSLVVPDKWHLESLAMCLTPEGEPLWHLQFRAPGEDDDFILRNVAASTTPGECFLSGNFLGAFLLEGEVYQSVDGSDAVLARINSAGKPVWVRLIEDHQNSTPRSLKLDRDGNLLWCGLLGQSGRLGPYHFQAEDYSGNGFLAKLDPNGNPLWLQQVTGPDRQDCTGLAVGAHNEIILAGRFQTTARFGELTLEASDTNKFDGFLAGLNQDGRWAWAVTAPDPGSSMDMTWISQNELIVAGGSPEQVYHVLLPDSESSAPNQPRLEILRNGSRVLVSYPESITGFRLEYCDALSPESSWNPIPDDPVQIGGQNVHNVETQAKSRIFRLHRQEKITP